VDVTHDIPAGLAADIKEQDIRIFGMQFDSSAPFPPSPTCHILAD
jgi:hypothetical protein